MELAAAVKDSMSSPTQDADMPSSFTNSDQTAESSPYGPAPNENGNNQRCQLLDVVRSPKEKER